jgi:DNA repair exonuclease SbcCD nuclease subunit
MRLGIIGDTHFGYDWNGGRQEDSFELAEEAFERVIAEKPDLIILPGDIFDSRVPSQEVLARAMRILSTPLHAEKSPVKLVESKKSYPDRLFSGIPVIAIHGTHERRGANFTNPIQAMEAAGLLMHLHCSTAVFEKKGGEKVAIHGMSGVPEMYSLDIFREWNPGKVEDAFNVLVIHQNFKECVYRDAAFMEISDIPEWFNLVICGHVHHHDFLGNKFLLTGSTILTQMQKRESETKKGYMIYDTKKKDFKFNPLERQRAFIYLELDLKGETAPSAEEKARDILKKSLEKDFERKPLVKLKLTGELKTGANLDRKDITRGFGEKAMISVDTSGLESADFKKRIQTLRELQKQKKSITELGAELLTKNLQEAGYKGPEAEKMLELLVQGNTEKTIEEIYKKFEG